MFQNSSNMRLSSFPTLSPALTSPVPTEPENQQAIHVQENGERIEEAKTSRPGDDGKPNQPSSAPLSLSKFVKQMFERIIDPTDRWFK
jgi:hypothetical protein